MQNTPGKCYDQVWEDGNLLLFWLMWKSVSPDSRKRMVDIMGERWPAHHRERRAKRSVAAEHKTLAGMLCWIVAWREGATDSFTVLCANTRICKLIQATMGSWMHTLTLSVNDFVWVSVCVRRGPPPNDSSCCFWMPGELYSFFFN